MEHTTKREDDANSDINDNLDREKGKVSYGKIKNLARHSTFHVEQPENMVYGTKTKLISSKLFCLIPKKSLDFHRSVVFRSVGPTERKTTLPIVMVSNCLLLWFVLSKTMTYCCPSLGIFLFGVAKSHSG